MIIRRSCGGTGVASSTGRRDIGMRVVEVGPVDHFGGPRRSLAEVSRRPLVDRSRVPIAVCKTTPAGSVGDLDGATVELGRHPSEVSAGSGSMSESRLAREPRRC
jgi:hypothetical protein